MFGKNWNCVETAQFLFPKKILSGNSHIMKTGHKFNVHAPRAREFISGVQLVTVVCVLLNFQRKNVM